MVLNYYTKKRPRLQEKFHLKALYASSGEISSDVIFKSKVYVSSGSGTRILSSRRISLKSKDTWESSNFNHEKITIIQVVRQAIFWCTLRLDCLSYSKNKIHKCDNDFFLFFKYYFAAYTTAQKYLPTIQIML